MITNNKASIVRSLESISKAMESKSEVDLVDVRILACGLLQLMNPKESNSFGPNLTMDGIHRRIKGKHVIVSMGRNGVLWCGPKDVLGKDADIAIDDSIACKHVPAYPLGQHEIVHTNGAGDAMGAGIIAALLAKDGNVRGPTLDCIQQGIIAARDHMISK
jgi:sugar/nucleoside kinase (ribokinase family)